MENKIIEIKQNYIQEKAILLTKFSAAKETADENVKSFASKLTNEFLLQKKSINDQSKIKKLKRNLKLDISAYRLEQNMVLASLKVEIKELKNQYKIDCNNVWKEKNIKKQEQKRDIFNSKVEEVTVKFDTKLDLTKLKYENLINNKNEKIKLLRDQFQIDENKFIGEYNVADDFYDSEFLAATQYKNESSVKTKVRFLKQEIRQLTDLKEEKILKITSQKEIKLTNIEQNYQKKFEFNKTFSKFWFTNELLTWVNNAARNVDQQRHMYAIKMGLVYLMPFTLIAAFWTLLNSVILSTNAGGFLHLIGVAETQGLTNFKAIGGIVSNATLGILGMGLAFGASATLGNRYKLGKIESGLIGLSSFMIFIPMISGKIMVNNEVAFEWANIINFAELGTSSMFLAIIISIGSIELYRLLMNIDIIKIKMPKEVPTAVAKSFNILIPFLILTFIFASMSFSLLYFAHKNLNELIQLAIAGPLSSGVESLGGAMLIRFLTDGFWAIGIHGENMVSTVLGPIYLAAINENMSLIEQGLEPINIVTSTFMDVYLLPMKTTVVIVALFIFSRRKDHLAIMSVAFIPALFNISEPILFGLPIILNPLLGIPFVLGGQVIVIIAYFLTSTGFVDPMSSLLPWTTPAFIGPFLGSAGDPMAVVTALILFAIGVVIYAPFIMIANTQSKIMNPDSLVTRFSFKNKFGHKKEETYEYLAELEKENKISIKQK